MIGYIVLERNKRSSFVDCGRDHLEDGEDKLIKRWDRRNTVVTTFIMSTRGRFRPRSRHVSGTADPNGFMEYNNIPIPNVPYPRTLVRPVQVWCDHHIYIML
jgi:hypothetical protein